MADRGAGEGGGGPGDDLKCMRRLGDGDDLALNELMGRWKEPLITFCHRYTGNLADAREIAQETFVKVYQNRHRYRPKAAFSTWMFTIASNLCKMRARWRSRHPEVLEADRDPRAEGSAAAPHTPPPAPDPSTESDRRTLAADLASAIRRLPHDLRVAFILAEVEGRPQRDVAGVLGCSTKAVERRLARARAQLRATLEPHWGER